MFPAYSCWPVQPLLSTFSPSCLSFPVSSCWPIPFSSFNSLPTNDIITGDPKASLCLSKTIYWLSGLLPDWLTEEPVPRTSWDGRESWHLLGVTEGNQKEVSLQNSIFMYPKLHSNANRHCLLSHNRHSGITPRGGIFSSLPFGLCWVISDMGRIWKVKDHFWSCLVSCPY